MSARISFFLLLFFVVISSFTLVLTDGSNLSIIDSKLPDKCSKPRGTQAIEYVMLHFCSDAVENPENPFSFQKIKNIFSNNGVSAHYLIDREGKVYRLVDETRIAYHAGKGKLPHTPSHENGLNSRSIGIEMMAIGTAKEMSKFMSADVYAKVSPSHKGFTEAQYSSLNLLLKDIKSRHSSLSYDRKHIVGHDEYAPERRSDPGSLFDWKKIGL